MRSSTFGPILDDTIVDILGSSPQSMFGTALPIAGALSLAIDNVSFSRTIGGGGTWDYEIRFTTATVPEPAEMWSCAASLQTGV